MNNGFDLDQNNNENNEMKMPDEEKAVHKSIFSRLCFAVFAYVALAEGLAFAVSYVLKNNAPELLESNNFALILSSVVQYAIAFPLFYFIVKKLPKQAPEKRGLSLKRFLKYGSVGMMLIFLGNNISSELMSLVSQLLGRTPENAVNAVLSKSDLILAALLVGIIGPIFEELMFRKLFIDRLTPYGDLVAIFFPSFMFGLFHGNFYQFFYTFFIGITFSYIYLRSGKIIYSTLLHIFVNLFCGIFPTYILSLLDIEELMDILMNGTMTEEYIMANSKPFTLLLIYEAVFFAASIVGIFAITKNLRDLRFNKGRVKLPRGEGADIMLFNPGAIAFISLSLVIMALSVFLM